MPFSFHGQTNASSDAVDNAKAYCKCLLQNGAPKQRFYAKTVCDGEFVQRYRLFRINMIEIRARLALSNATRDSAIRYKKEFDRYTSQHCCDMILNCAIDSAKRQP